MVGIYIAVVWLYGGGDNNSLPGMSQWLYHACMAMDIIPHPHQWLYHGSALHFVVILSDHIFLATDVETGEHLFQRSRQVPRLPELGLFLSFNLPSSLHLPLG